MMNILIISPNIFMIFLIAIHLILILVPSQKQNIIFKLFILGIPFFFIKKCFIYLFY